MQVQCELSVVGGCLIFDDAAFYSVVDVSVQPLIKVSNQLVAAPLDSDVVIQCYVEASPTAMNSWYRDNGEFFFVYSVLSIVRVCG